MNPDYPDEVRQLRDRIGAAFMRGEMDYALDLINAERLLWEAKGRDQERRGNEKYRDQEAEVVRSAKVYFETRDGLRSAEKIGVPGHWPYRYNRPCIPKSFGLAGIALPHSLHYEVRTYELSSQRAKDGRPVYLEV